MIFVDSCKIPKMPAWLARSVLLIYLINLSSSPAELRTGNVTTAKERNLMNKRGLAEFGLMIYCATGRNPFDFNGYGCWCGIGGEGEPVDDLDRCCQAHDNCYKDVRTSGACPTDASIYVMPYSRTGCTSCEPVSYYWFWGRCRNALCECDATAARCFATTPYNQVFEDYKGKCE